MKQQKEPIKSFAALGEALGITTANDVSVRPSKNKYNVDSSSTKSKNPSSKQSSIVKESSNKKQVKSESTQVAAKIKATQVAFVAKPERVLISKNLQDNNQINNTSRKKTEKPQHSNIASSSTQNNNTKINQENAYARIHYLSKDFNCMPQIIVDYLSLFFEREFKSTSLLHKNEFDIIISHFKSNKSSENYKFYVTKEGDSILKNGYSLPSHDLPIVFEQDIFQSPVEKYFDSGLTNNSCFTDDQALNICKKMADAFARNIALQFQKYRNEIIGDEYRNQIHYLANKALKLYGGPILTFLSNLRPLNFGNLTADTLSSKHLYKTDVYFPAMTFSSSKNDEKFTLVFHSSSGLHLPGLDGCVRVYSSSSSGHNQLGSIDRKGYLLNKLQKMNPSLLLFCDSVKGGSAIRFFSGVETGNCFVCGRELTHPDSIRYGIGKACLKNIGC